MKRLKDHTVAKYLNALSEKSPVPGGGSAAALTGALGASLLCMVGHYSLHKHNASVDKKLNKSLQNFGKIQKRLLALVDLDARAYLNVVKSKNSSLDVKKKALAKAEAVPQEICHLCYKAIVATPVLVKYGNKYLMSDLEAAVDLLLASFNSALHFTHQSGH